MLNRVSSVTACLIVKNEAETLETVLDALDWCDEMIVGIDSQSTDASEDIALKFGAEVYHFDFDRNFAQSRNKGFEKVKTEWIIQPDGHETLRFYTGTELRKMDRRDWDLLIHKMSAYQIITAQLWNGIDEDGLPGTIFYAPRIYKSTYRMKGATHNYLDRQKKSAGVACPQLILLHKRSHELDRARHEQRREMNIDNLMKDVDTEPENGRPLFYLGQTEYEMGNTDKAIEWYKKHLEVSDFDSEKYQSCLMLGRIYGMKKDYKESIRWFSQCASYEVARNDHTVMIGDCWKLLYDESVAQGKDDWNKLTLAKYAYEKATLYCAHRPEDIPKHVPNTPHFVNGHFISYYPFLRLMQCYDCLGDYDKALEAQKIYLNFRPSDRTGQKNLRILEKSVIERKLRELNTWLGI